MSKIFKGVTVEVSSSYGALDAIRKAASDAGAEYHIKAGGSLDLRGLTSLPANAKLTAGGYLYLSGLTSLPANAKLTAGGDLDLSGLTHKTEHKGGNPDARRIAREAVTAMFMAIGYSIADGVLAKIVQTRGNVQRVIIEGKTDISYLVTDGEAYSHGKTLKEARDGLLYKIGNRDTSQFKAWSLDKIVTKREAITAYRTITGACEGGVRAWMEQRQTPDSLKVKEIIDLTKGAYGAEQFAGFFKAEAVAK